MKLRVLYLLMTLVLVWSAPPTDQSVVSPVSILEHAPHADMAVALAEAGVSESDLAPATQALPAADEVFAADLLALLPPCGCAAVSALRTVWPGLYATPSRLAPYLDGPQRPPRVTHFLA